MRDCDNLDFGRRFTEHNQVGKAAKHHPLCIKHQLRELARRLLNTL